VSTCHSFKTTDEVVPESMLLASQFSKLSPKTFIQATISSGGSEADCNKFATDTIADTTAVVNDQQGELNAVDTGAGCATEGDFVVTAAQIALAKFKAGEATAQTAHTNAASAQATACSAPVSFAVNLDTLESSECFSYQSQGDYDSVKSVCTIDTQTTATAVSTLNTAKTAVADATSALADAETESARLTSECNCRVQTEQAEAWTAASAATAAQAADWKQAQEVLCALDKSTDTCKYAACPTVTQPTVAAGVAEETCVAQSFVATQIVYDPDAGDGTHGNDGVEDSWSASLLGVPNTAYTVSYEILNSDLDLDDEKLVRVVVGGVSMPGCGGEGDNRPDYQCDFTECNSSSQTVTADSSGNIAVVATYTNNSKDCDCDQSDPNGNCVKEDTGSAEWTPTKAALKFTLTQA